MLVFPNFIRFDHRALYDVVTDGRVGKRKQNNTSSIAGSRNLDKLGLLASKVSGRERCNMTTDQSSRRGGSTHNSFNPATGVLPGFPLQMAH